MSELSRLAAFGLVVFALVSSPASDEPTKEKAKSPICDCVQCDCENCDCGEPKEPEPTEPDPDPIRHSEIIIYTMPNCPACVTWKQRYMNDLTSKGWTVVERPVESRHSVAPSFRVWLNGRSTDKSGFMTMTDLKRLMKTGDFAVRQTVSTVSPDYKARWTYPSPLEKHLQGWPHNLDTTGMTKAEMEAYHDGCHDKIGPVNAAQLRAKSFNVSSSCPSGNCPTRTYTRRRGLFGVFR